MIRKKDRYTIIYFLDYGNYFGGAANTVLQQAILMKQNGHRVIIFFSDYLGRKIEEGYKEIFCKLDLEWEWATYQLSSQPEDIDIVCVNRNYEKLKNKIAEFSPDILQSVQINVSVELASRELKIPHIMNIYQLIPDFFSINYINIFAHYHFCDSFYFAEKWKYYLKTDSICVRTISNKQKTNRVLGVRSLNYICVGSILERKNQLTVIKAFHRALKHGIHGRLMLCGYEKGEYGDNCLKYINENRLSETIIIEGFCSDMHTKYAMCDVLICGSKIESYPNVISEALANRLAIISTPVAGVPEVIKDKVNGYITKDFSEYAIYEKIMELNSDCENGKIEKILKNAEESFQKNHAPESVLEQLLCGYRHVLDDYSRNENKAQETVLPQIMYIRTLFKKKLLIFEKNLNNFSAPEKVALKLWYIHHIEPEILNRYAQGTDFYIWGTGKYGLIVMELISTFWPMIHITGYLDSKKKDYFLDYRVYQPDEVFDNESAVIFIAAVNGQNEMIDKLKRAGKDFNRDYYILAPRRW